ncbi:HD domain-containing protein [Candidatus Saccharibacteria bacterium]|nr:HD domain-containing protein [Candidatus Saccharibacteria bacterium]
MSKVDSKRRVDEQLTLGNKIYDAIDQKVDDGEARHHHILRDCVGTLAVSLELSHGYRFAGDAAHHRLLQHLTQGDLTTNDAVYAPYSAYTHYVEELQDMSAFFPPAPSPRLATVIGRYAKVQRATRDLSGQPETNSRHVVHVSAMSVPYALEEYPDLDPSLVSSYGFVHDILEAYTGDTATLNISKKDYAKKQLDEAKALKEFTRAFAQQYPKLVALVERYEELGDDESMFLKSHEKGDPGYTHFSDGGAVVKELGVTSPAIFWQKHRETYERMSHYAINFPQVLEDRDTRAAMIEKVIWPTAKNSSL